MGCNYTPINVPTIESFSPLTTSVDKEITITGTNFSANSSENLVHINGFPCPVLSATTTQLVIKVVPWASSGTVSVTVDHLTVNSKVDFTLIPHTIDSIAPRSGAIGDKINLGGHYYCDLADSVTVKFDSIVAPVLNYIPGDSTTFSFTVPKGLQPGTTKITVKIGDITVPDKYDFEVN
ncbi:MAG TPA: IPT/TIG domain-containing protein [Cyclobacteriaceae bacterium]